MMVWKSVDEFLAMGGYGLFVWGSYAVAALAMGLEPWLAGRRRRQALRDARRHAQDAQRRGRDRHGRTQLGQGPSGGEADPRLAARTRHQGGTSGEVEAGREH